MWVFLKSSASKTGNFFTKLAIIGNTPLSLAARLEARCGPCNLRCHSKDVIKGSFVAVVNTGSFLLQAHWKIRGNQQRSDSPLGCVLELE